MPEYSWSCLACSASNAPQSQACLVCRCPASATVAQIETARQAVGIASPAVGIVEILRNRMERELAERSVIGTGVSECIAAVNVLAIGLFAWLGFILMLVSHAFLALTLVPGLAHLYFATMSSMFPFLMLAQADQHEPMFSAPVLLTLVHWCLIAIANAALVRSRHSRRPLVSAFLVVGLSGIGAAFLIWALSLEISHLHM